MTAHGENEQNRCADLIDVSIFIWINFVDMLCIYWKIVATKCMAQHFNVSLSTMGTFPFILMNDKCAHSSKLIQSIHSMNWMFICLFFLVPTQNDNSFDFPNANWNEEEREKKNKLIIIWVRFMWKNKLCPSFACIIINDLSFG